MAVQDDAAKRREIIGIDFPPYEYHEYPKMVKSTAGTRVKVHSAEEEMKVAGKITVRPKTAAEEEIEQLRAQIQAAKAKEEELNAALAAATSAGFTPGKTTKPANAGQPVAPPAA